MNLTQVYVESLNMQQAIKLVTRHIYTRESLDTDGFTGLFDQMFKKKKLKPILYRLLKVHKEKTISNSLYEDSTVLISK